MSLDEIERVWLAASTRALHDVMHAHPSMSFYAAAFHMFYCDDSQILTPSLAVNAESYVTTENDRESTWTTRWALPEWNWPVLDDASDAMKPIYSRLSHAMVDASQSDWLELIASHDEMMARVARELTRQIHTTSDFQAFTLPVNFVVAVLEGQRDTEDYNALVRASIEPDRFAQLEGVLLQ